MSGLLNPSQKIVALVTRTARGELTVNACNDAFRDMTGCASLLPAALDSLIPERALHDAIEACLRSEEVPSSERVVEFEKDGQNWRISLELIDSTRNGTTVREVLMTGIDRAPEKHLTHELEVSARRFRAVVDSAYDAIVTIDEAHRIRLFNRAAENLFGYAASEVLGQRIEMLLPERARAHHARNVNEFANSPLTSLRSMTAPRMDESNSVFGRHRDGTIIPVEIAISKIDLGGVIEFTAVVRDITERAQLMELLKQQAVTDALTGLPNRREFIDFVEKALAGNDLLSVFILDIDYFKAINDSFGHDIGDEVLRVLAHVGKSIPLDSMLFARWGGEEFVAALPDADARQALHIADALRARFEQQDFEHVWRVKPIPFTVSIGVVTREEGERDVDALMRRADRALYEAKEKGRNRVEVG
jgi:diguanylate cyclase (GGDEF)-like protein/PAS domain S-box-containing protein